MAEAMRITSAAAMQCLLDFFPLRWVIMGEVRILTSEITSTAYEVVDMQSWDTVILSIMWKVWDKTTWFFQQKFEDIEENWKFSKSPHKLYALKDVCLKSFTNKLSYFSHISNGWTSTNTCCDSIFTLLTNWC